jgi:tRNA-specific adenosine deaminase 2
MCTLAVPTTGLEAPAVFCPYMPSQYISKTAVDCVRLTGYSSSIDPTYPAYGGLFEKEAIMLLRRFYIQENEKGK